MRAALVLGIIVVVIVVAVAATLLVRAATQAGWRRAVEAARWERSEMTSPHGQTIVSVDKIARKGRHSSPMGHRHVATVEGRVDVGSHSEYVQAVAMANALAKELNEVDHPEDSS